ncbi:MAG: FAD:protein FMN transferase [Bacteroidetes bacterium]|nr:FAD:protein FMN transferase [Bacteroidota bacterium]
MSRRSPIAITMVVLALFCAGFYIALQFAKKDDDSVSRTQIALGTLIEVQVRGLDREAADAAINAAFAEVRRVDTLFSTYKPESPVWKLNHGSDTLVMLPDEVYTVLLRCDTLWRRSKGAFDVAVQPLIEAWGFDGENPAVPSDAVLQVALRNSGWNHITLDADRTVRKPNGAGVNFGAIAKGYAVDRAVTVLRDRGVSEALVNAGGEIRATGGSWQVGIQHPRSPSELLAVVDPQGRAIATSGDYEQFFEKDGVRYHHIFDPSTGFPARGCQSVSVIAGDDMTADALATAVFVMGPAAGLEFLQQYPDIEALIVDDQGVEHRTSGFDRYRTR